MTFDEDRSQVRAGTLTRVLASLPNTAINLLRLTGHSDIASATRHHSRTSNEPSHAP